MVGEYPLTRLRRFFTFDYEDGGTRTHGQSIETVKRSGSRKPLPPPTLRSILMSAPGTWQDLLFAAAGLEPGCVAKQMSLSIAVLPCRHRSAETWMGKADARRIGRDRCYRDRCRLGLRLWGRLNQPQWSKGGVSGHARCSVVIPSISEIL